MTNAVVATALVVASIVAVAWTLTYGHSMIARERFLLDMAAFRDRVEDAVFAGDLPDVEPVQYLWQKAHVLERHPEVVSLANFLAFTLTPDVTKVKFSRPSANRMSPTARRELHALEDEFVSIMARYVVSGSRYWLVLRVLDPILEAHARRSASAGSKDPIQMSKEFSRVLDNTAEELPNGQRRVSPLLLTA